MTPAGTQGPLRSRARVASPLSHEESARVEGVARRLESELSALVATFPLGARSATGMSRAFGIHRSVAQRLTTGLQASGDTALLIAGLPGVEGLRRCIACAREGQTSATEATFAAADSAVDAFEALIKDLAGSHTKLVARMNARFGASESPDRVHDLALGTRSVERRRRVHDAVVEMLGRTTRLRASISLMRPCPGDPGRVEYAHVRAYSGQRASVGALPMLLSSDLNHRDGDGNTFEDCPDFQALDGSSLSGRSKSALVEAFCGTPRPVVTTRDEAGRFTQVIDAPKPGESGEFGDIVLAYRIPGLSVHPARQDPAVYCETMGVREPVQRMIMDVYLHSDLVAGCTPSMSVYLGQRSVNCDLTDRWFDRIEGDPPLTLLGSGLHNAAHPDYARHAALTAHAFHQLGWDAGNFVGFRCDEPYPQWGCDYTMAFDYR